MKAVIIVIVMVVCWARDCGVSYTMKLSLINVRRADIELVVLFTNLFLGVSEQFFAFGIWISANKCEVANIRVFGMVHIRLELSFI